MSSSVVDRRTLRHVPLVVLAWTVTACGDAAVPDGRRTPAAVTPTPTPVPSPHATEGEGLEPPSASLVALAEIQPGMETPGTEMPDTQAYGRWKVIDAAGPPGGNAMIGRTLSFTEDALGWLDAKGKVEPGCPYTMYHIPILASQVREAAPLFRPGWSRFRLPPDKVGAMHVWECDDGTSVFGPPETGGSMFVPVGKDRLVMNWMNGAVLLLRKDGGER